MDSKRRKAIIFLLIIVLIVVSILLMLIMQKRENQNVDIISNIVANTNWPISDVPLLPCKDLKIVELDAANFSASSENGISYSELRKYLITLYDSGFKPNETYGAQNPHSMYESIEGSSINDILWIGEKNDNYVITIHWTENKIENSKKDEYERTFSISLFIKSKRAELGNNEMYDISEWGEFIESGDELVFSGDYSFLNNGSGDNESGEHEVILESSGESLSGDATQQ